MSKQVVQNSIIAQHELGHIFGGLTESVAVTKSEAYVDLDDFGRIVLRAVDDSKRPKYDMHKVFAVRDCCVLVNGLGHNTAIYRLGEGDMLLQALRYVKPSDERLWLLKNVVGKHLSCMHLEMRTTDGGFEIVDVDGHDEEAVVVSE